MCKICQIIEIPDRGEGVPHLHPIILPLIPCNLLGEGYPSDWSRVPSGGYSNHSNPRWGRGVPVLGVRVGGWVCQSQVGGVP